MLSLDSLSLARASLCAQIDYVTGDFFVTRSAVAAGMVEHTIDVQRIPFPPSHFDVIVILHVLEHVPSLRDSLAELFRVLRPGGLAVVAVPDARDLAITHEANGSTTPDEREKYFGQVDHYRRVGRDFPQVLRGFGFDVERIEIGEWYARRPESRLFGNEEYDINQPFYYRELVFMATKPVMARA